MRKYYLVLLLLFVLQFFLIHVCHIDGRWLLMDMASAVESDMGAPRTPLFP